MLLILILEKFLTGGLDQGYVASISWIVNMQTGDYGKMTWYVVSITDSVVHKYPQCLYNTQYKLISW